LSTWFVNDEIGKLTVSPELIVFETVSAVHTSKLPPLTASINPICVTVPQPAEGVAKEMATLLLVVPPVPVLGFVVVVAPFVAAQFVVLAARPGRA
jgi:hypothetical protein